MLMVFGGGEFSDIGDYSLDSIFSYGSMLAKCS